MTTTSHDAGASSLAPLSVSISDAQLSSRPNMGVFSAGRSLTAEHIMLAGMNPDHLLLTGANANDVSQVEAVRTDPRWKEVFLE